MKHIILFFFVALLLFSCDKNSDYADYVISPRIEVFYIDKNGKHDNALNGVIELISSRKNGIEMKDVPFFNSLIFDSYAGGLDGMAIKKVEYFMKWKNKISATEDSLIVLATIRPVERVFADNFLYNGKRYKYYDASLDDTWFYHSKIDSVIRNENGGYDTVAILSQECFRLFIPIDTVMPQ